jgi:Uncharacterized protein conserved in bacteria (DUF2334).
MKCIYSLFLVLFSLCTVSGNATLPSAKKVLIITENAKDYNSAGLAEARILENLMGHFQTRVSIVDIANYQPNTINSYDVIFYLGVKREKDQTALFMKDAVNSAKTIVWMNSGLEGGKTSMYLRKKLGFGIDRLDTSGVFTLVRSGNHVFTRTNDAIYMPEILKGKGVVTIATAFSPDTKQQTPYMLRSGKFYYVADIPFVHITDNDRYLLFSDALHDIIGEKHQEEHGALVRIEDVIPTRDPDNLRAMADILYERHVPFLIGLVPFYIDPKDHIRISLSDRPELVEALKYCVSKGGTIVLHGVTHQYKGESAVDYEFWDASTNRPIKEETPEEIEHKIETGIDECAKNGIYPLMWETPHYTASMETYQVVSKYFGSAVERVITTNNNQYGQYFPYVIKSDVYGQKIYPEDLGYLPLIDDRDSTEHYIKYILNRAKTIRSVRDGYASFFFHSFLDPDYLRELVDGIKGLGFTFTDLRKESNWVKSKDMVILSGSQAYTMNVNHSFLEEVYYDKNGNIEKKEFSKGQVNGRVNKHISLKPDEFYLALPLQSIQQKRITNKHHS